VQADGANGEADARSDRRVDVAAPRFAGAPPCVAPISIDPTEDRPRWDLTREFAMSMEMFVLSDRRLDSIAAWQQALDAAGDPLLLSTARPFDALHGALPVTLRDRPTAFECDHRDAAELMAEITDIAFDRPWRSALAFCWGGDFDAGASAYLAAAAYAEATGGVILDCEEGRLISPARAREVAADLEQNGPKIIAMIHRGIGPSGGA